MLWRFIRSPEHYGIKHSIMMRLSPLRLWIDCSAEDMVTCDNWIQQAMSVSRFVKEIMKEILNAQLGMVTALFSHS